MKKNVVEKILNYFGTESISEKFIEETKIHSPQPSTPSSTWPESWKTVYFKSYPRYQRIYLPKDFSAQQNINLISALTQRKSSRTFIDKSVNLSLLSKILLYSFGIKDVENIDWNRSRRYYPSAGAKYPIEAYVIANRVAGLEGKFYHYNVKQHSLEIIKKIDIVDVDSCFSDTWINQTAFLIIMSGIFARTELKYRARGLRHIFIEAGHIGQNISLLCAEQKLGCCAIGGYVDGKLNELFELDGINESVIYALGIGKTDSI